MSPKKLRKELMEEPVQLVLGPGNVPYVVDKHHQTLAAMQAGVTEVYAHVRADYSALSPAEFQTRMKAEGLVYLYVPGSLTPIQFSDLPTTLQDMVDDPYRSLAWRVRKKGGYKKTNVLYAEFQWADFFRTRIRPWKTQREFDARTEEALELAGSKAAKSLPGYDGDCGGPLSTVARFAP